MEKDRNSKVIAIVALIVAVVGLGIGFAAFSSTLTISSSATVTPDDSTFKVAFTGDVTCTPAGGATVTSSGTATETNVSGIDIAFTAPGQSATCTVSAANTGEFLAYLNSITMGKVTCEASEGSNADAGLVAEACKGVSVEVAVGSDKATSTTTTEGTNNAITDHTLAAKTGTEAVTLKIQYAADAARADGAFNISVPTATLTYSTVD